MERLVNEPNTRTCVKREIAIWIGLGKGLWGSRRAARTIHIFSIEMSVMRQTDLKVEVFRFHTRICNYYWIRPENLVSEFLYVRTGPGNVVSEFCCVRTSLLAKYSDKQIAWLEVLGIPHHCYWKILITCGGWRRMRQAVLDPLRCSSFSICIVFHVYGF